MPLPGRFPIWSDLEVSVLLPPPRSDPLGSTSPVPHPSSNPPGALEVEISTGLPGRPLRCHPACLRSVFFYGRDFSCPAFLLSRRFMGCANFNPGETAHRSRIFTRVEASCAVAGGEKTGGGTSGNIWRKWRGTCMSRLSGRRSACVREYLAVKYERASARPATAWAQRRQFQAEDGTGPVARSSGVSLPPFVQAV